MNIAINAMLAGSNGSIDYLRHILPAMEAQSPEHRWFVYGSDETIEKLRFPASRVVFRPVAIGTGVISRLIQTHIRLPKLLRSEGIDLVFSPDNLDLFLAPRPRVVALRDVDPLLTHGSASSIRAWIRKSLARWFTRRSLKAADQVVFSSEFARKTVTHAAPGCEWKSVTFPDGVAAPSVPPGQLPDWAPDEYLLVTTDAAPEANLQTVISAYCICREKGLHIPILLTGSLGSDRYARRIRKQVGKLGLGPHVDFVEHLTGRELEPLMAGARAVIHCSVPEHSPTGLLTAMRNGAAVVAVETPPAREVAGDAVIWCPEGDVWTMAHNILRICRNHSYRRRLQRGARNHAKKYSWESTAANLVRLFEQTGKGSQPRPAAQPKSVQTAAHGVD